MCRLRISFVFLLVWSLSTLLHSCKNETVSQVGGMGRLENNVPIELADPTIFFDDGVYYLYGTGGDVNNGFLVYTSVDLKKWEGPKGCYKGYALIKGDTYGTAGFWAPHIFKQNKKFYIAYTANEQIAIASSDSPLGPFKQSEFKQISGAKKQIDPFVFFDENGKIYLYHVRLENGNKLYVAEMHDDLSDIIPETARLCIEAEAGTWEDTENVSWRVSEGPTIIKHNQIYYLFYSANDFRNIDYAVGYATSDSPMGPWTKHPDNPIISRQSVHLNGAGHGDFFRDAGGKWHYVFHVHASDSAVNPRKTAIVAGYFSKQEGQIEPMSISHDSFELLER